MFTAKSLQLLDASNNNISPATNIETVYYEYKEGGLVKRNHIFKHFPVYVQHTFSIEDNLFFNADARMKNFIFKEDITKHSKLLHDIQNYNKAISTHKNKVQITGESIKLSDIDKGKPLIPELARDVRYHDLLDTAELRESYNKSDGTNDNAEIIYVSSVQEKRFKNTDFKVLDISTYNLTDILSKYALNNWVRLSYETLKKRLDYVTVYHADVNQGEPYYSNMYTVRDVGSINAGTLIKDLDGMRYDELLDDMFGLGYEPTYKPLVVTATFPMLYYMQDRDLEIKVTDNLPYNDFSPRNVTIENININIKYLPQFSFGNIADMANKKYAQDYQPKCILGKQWRYETPLAMENKSTVSPIMLFEKESTDDKRVRRSAKVKAASRIVPSLKQPVQIVNDEDEKRIKFILPDNKTNLKVLDYERLGNNIRKSNLKLLFENSTNKEDACWLWLRGNPDNQHQAIVAHTYSRLNNGTEKLIKTATKPFKEKDATGDYSIAFPNAEIIPAYPIYYGQTQQRKSMKCYWAYGQQLHKIAITIHPGQPFYVAIPKIVVSQLRDPFPHRYKIFQQSKWQMATDWVIEEAMADQDNGIFTVYKIVTYGTGKVRDIMFTIDFRIQNLL